MKDMEVHMIIDIHRHPLAEKWYSPNFWNGFARMVVPMLVKTGIPATTETVMHDFFPIHYDTDGAVHLSKMDEAGIDKTTMFLYDVGLLAGEPEVLIEQQNQAVLDMAKRHPDRIIPFVHLDPRRPGAADFVRKCVEEGGARGLKLHPSSGFNPSDIDTLLLIEAIADFDIPVLTHTGPPIPPTSSRYCAPVYLDEMLLRFPEVNVIAAHMAPGHSEELFVLGWQRPNLYTDLSAWQVRSMTDFAHFARTVRSALDLMGPEKVMFGTDSPWFWSMMSEKDWVQAVRDLPGRSPEDINFSPEEINRILGLNAMEILKL
jgi:predicted TIM-barrel fold metal-dependent hydrolase